MWRSLTFAQLNSFTGKVESGQLREMVSWRGRDANSLIYSMSISGNCSLHPTLHVRCCYSTVTAFEQDLSVSWGVQTKSAQSSTRSEYGLLQGVWCHLVRLKKQLPNRWYIIVFHQGIRQKRGWSGESQLYTNLVQPGLVVSSSGIVYHNYATLSENMCKYADPTKRHRQVCTPSSTQTESSTHSRQCIALQDEHKQIEDSLANYKLGIYRLGSDDSLIQDYTNFPTLSECSGHSID